MNRRNRFVDRIVLACGKSILWLVAIPYRFLKPLRNKRREESLREDIRNDMPFAMQNLSAPLELSIGAMGGRYDTAILKFSSYEVRITREHFHGGASFWATANPTGAIRNTYRLDIVLKALNSVGVLKLPALSVDAYLGPAEVDSYLKLFGNSLEEAFAPENVKLTLKRLEDYARSPTSTTD